MSFIHLLRKTINITSSGIPKLHVLQHWEFLVLSSRYICSEPKEHRFSVTYLINKCGLSPESAFSASRYVNFETPDKADSVLALFENYGFSKTQIGILVKGLPQVLSSDPAKTLLPKLEFFRSRCVSTTDITKIFCYNPGLLKRSLEKHIIPSFNILKELLKSEEKTIASIKRFGKILLIDLDTFFVPNINVLREYGVPESKIITLIHYQPRSIAGKTHIFRENVEEVKKMGFNPLRLKFVLAVYALRTMSRSTWDTKFKVYKDGVGLRKI
ncbi:uncharacterized protein LOC110819957 [Carica papaya]|uniref:uncharacterized protein LOC110819957 n=1 Tax=Carica papaya TaxID=3649 RepID=UPI000B8C8656|nr:uncharacterized protein LOC110819957 [Carica papaya]